MRFRGLHRMVKSILGVSVLVASFALHAQGAAVEMVVNVFSMSGDPLNAITPGDQIIYEIGVIVDPNYSGPPPEPGRGAGNRGLATLVYNVFSAEAAAGGHFLSPMQDAFSGFDFDFGNPQTVASPFFNSNVDTAATHYGGGWGFNRAGLPGGGTVTSAGAIIAAGVTAPLSWAADVNGADGLQPFARLDVGVGAYTFPSDDPTIGGRTGGFGQNFSNLDALEGTAGKNIDGDGTWVVQFGVIDTAGWNKQTYNFDVELPQGGASLFDGTVDYSIDQVVFRLNVEPISELMSTEFAFTLIPEPGTLTVLAIGALAIIRRRRG